MINIRLIIYSLIEPKFKEVGWLHRINNILVLSFYNNGTWENTSIEELRGISKSIGLDPNTLVYSNEGNYIGKLLINTVTSDIKALDSLVKSTEVNIASDFNTFNKRIETAESTIVLQAGLISTKVELESFNELNNKVSKAESDIVQNADAIKLKVSQTDFNDLGEKVTNAESTITLLADLIATKVSLDDFNNLGNRVSNTESSIIQTTKDIASKVSQTDFNALGLKVSTAETNITENANSISAQATNISNLTGRVSTAEAKITPEAINFTVKSQVDTSYTNAVNAAATNAAKLYVSSLLHQQDIATLLSQIDGSIETWFYEYIPTSDNAPTNTWVTDEVRNTHLGDLFYNTLTGYCYRYQLSDSVYSWAVITDTDVTTALANAAKAQDTADHKRRIFVTTPIVPYDVGDMWAQGSNGDILVCETAKIVGLAYNASDWVSAAKYTDDTLASEAKSDAAAAQSDATNALNNIASIISDNILDSSEKPSQRLAWNTISAEKANIDSNADIFGVSRTDYDNAFQTLANYLNNGITYTTGIPTWLSDINLSSNTIIVGSTYRTNWENYYTKRTLLLNSIALKTKTLADSAQNSANAAQLAANTAADSATKALNHITDLVSDNILSAAEKPAQFTEWQQAVSDNSLYDSEAVTYNISTEKTNYDNAFIALAKYLNGGTTWTSGTTPLWFKDLSTNTTIEGNTYRSTWLSYYEKRGILLNKITAQAKAIAESNAAADATNKINNAIGASKTYTDSQFKVASDLISSKVSQTDFNALGIRVDTAESNITLNADSIATKVSQIDFNALGQRVGTAESNITANSNSISSQVTSINDLTGRVSTAEAKITSDAINLTVKSQVDTAKSTAISTAATNAAALYVTSTAYSSQVTILQNSINAKVSQTDFNALNTRVGTAESNITQNATSITTKVSQTTFDALGTRVSTAESNITQNATDIGLKVSKDGVIGAINLTSEAATISASKINLQGAVTFSSFDSSTQATINGKKDTIYNYLSGNGVTDGVFHAATFTINGNYLDRPIKLSVFDRANTPSNVYIGFGTSSSLDPPLTMFKKDGTIPFYIVKTATSIWDLYIGQSTGRWSDVYINDFVNNNSAITVTWKNGTVSLPSGYVTATQMIGTAEWCYNNDITYIDGAHVYTGTLDAVSIVAGSITGDRIAANTITGDKIAANTITADKVNMSEFTASNGFVDSFNANVVTAGRLDVTAIVTKALTSNTITAANATITNLSLVNANVSGIFSSANVPMGNIITINAAATDDVLVCTGPKNVQDENPDLPQDSGRKALFKVHFDTDIDSLTRYATVSVNDGRDEPYSNGIVIDPYNGIHIHNLIGDVLTITCNGILYSSGSILHTKSWQTLLA